MFKNKYIEASFAEIVTVKPSFSVKVKKSCDCK